MPYIKKEDRKKFENILKEVEKNFPESAGELNYLLTSIILVCYDNSNKNYQVMNDFLGALEGCKLELYRRLISPYENKKIKENGDL